MKDGSDPKLVIGAVLREPSAPVAEVGTAADALLLIWAAEHTCVR